MKKLLFLALLSFSWMQDAQAQSLFPKKKYPAGAFANPLDIPISLVGNFGECRPNHFHSGIDIRTDSKENLAVHAIGDGFISRVKIEAGGFGNAIYITHGNGYTSLYAHLNRFFPELEKYVREKQYHDKSWKQDLYFLPHQFPVHKGMFIAKSGNTGSSQGPHLHLEIRDTKTENPLNPLLFFTQIQDTKPPVIKQVAMYDGAKSIYQQKPTLYAVKNKRLPKDTLLIHSDAVYFGISADDFSEIATGTLGVFELQLYVDGEACFAWQMDDISYDVTRYMNALADYKTKKNNGPWIQLAHKLPGDQLKVYKSLKPGDGMISLKDRNAHEIKLVAYDTKNNQTQVRFFVRSIGSSPDFTCPELWTPGKVTHVKKENMEADLPAEALYDVVCGETNCTETASDLSYQYTLHRSDVPVHSYFDLNVKPRQAIPTSQYTKLALQRLPYGSDTQKKGKAASFKNNVASASVRDFGTYLLVVDEKAPSISTALKNDMNISKLKQIQTVIKDDITSVSKCEMYVDGEWLRVVQKGDLFYYELDEHFPSGRHELVIKAYDENNNLNTLRFNLIR